MTAPLVRLATSQCCASVMPSGAGVLECAAHQLRVLHAVAVVGEQAHAGRGQLAERRQRLAGAADRDAAGRGHLAQAGARAPGRARTRSSTSESCAGSVFGIATIAVNPPSAAARLPVSIVSASSRPGSRRWTWRSTKPGDDDAAGGVERPSSSPSIDVPTSTTRPVSIATSARRSPCWSSTVPPRITIRGSSRRRSVAEPRAAAEQFEQHRHPHRDAVGHLVRGSPTRGAPPDRRPSRRRGSSGPGASPARAASSAPHVPA